jgi:hypothetical protein
VYEGVPVDTRVLSTTVVVIVFELLKETACVGQGLVDDRRGPTFGFRQVGVAGGKGETVRVADRIEDVHGHVQIEVLRDAAYQYTLSGVLLTKVGVGGLDNVKEFRDNGGHAPEMARAGLTFGRLVKALRIV